MAEAQKSNVVSFEVFRAAGSLVSRALMAARAGLTFGGKRDTFEVLGYKRVLEARDFIDQYTRDGIAQRVNDAMPKATWSGVGELIDDEESSKQTAFEEAWEKLNVEHKLWSVFARADMLAGLGRYGVILLGVPGDPSMPVSGAPGKLLYVLPLSEADAQVASTETDPENPRFGWPVAYNVRVGEESKNSKWKRVHHSRVIHVADNLLHGEVYGEPRLAPVWNRLMDLEKVVGGGAEAFWLRAHQGRIFNLDKDLEISTEEMNKFREEIDEMTHGMRRDVRARGLTVETLGSDVANFTGPVDTIVGLIAGMTGIPQRILLGSERGELASTQDRSNWADRVQERRDRFAFPYIVRPLVMQLIEWSVLPPPKDGEFSVRWNPAMPLTEMEKADLAKKQAEVNQAAGETVILANEIRDRTLGLPPLEDVLSPEELEALDEKGKKEEELDDEGNPIESDEEDEDEEE